MKKHAHILVVEDEQELNDLYVQLLEAEGHKVSSALDGKDAMKLLSEGGFDVVLLDIMLPSMDGLQILEQLHQKPPKKENKKLVLLTNLAKNDTIGKALQYGVEGYLIKSKLTPDEFIEQIQKYLT